MKSARGVGRNTLPRRYRGARADEPSSTPPAALGRIAEVFLYALLGVACLLVLIAGVQAFRTRGVGRRGGGTPPNDTTQAHPSPGGVASPVAAGVTTGDTLDMADRLAASGHFEEAAHLLLLAALERLSATSPSVGNRSRTSRELLGLLGLSPERLAAFEHLVRVVESSFFGARRIPQDVFHRCRGGFAAICGEDAA